VDTVPTRASVDLLKQTDGGRHKQTARHTSLNDDHKLLQPLNTEQVRQRGAVYAGAEPSITAAGT